MTYLLFEPYPDEYNRINSLKEFINNNYTIIRLTRTMIEKNNIDANYFMRSLMKKLKVVDYDELPNGGSNGIKYPAILYSKGHKESTTINFYRVAGKRSDPRFGFYKIKKFASQQILSKGDLLAIIPYKDKETSKLTIYIFNASFNLPSQDILSSIFNVSKSRQLLVSLLPKLKEIAQQGYHPNSKGAGKKAPKDAGDTLESLLGVKTNNRKTADIDGLIELKSKTNSGLDTLFTLRPSFDGTPVAKVESKDRSRVSAYTRMYGYFSDKHPNAKSLYVTISSTPNPQGLYLKVNEGNETVELRQAKAGHDDLTAFWKFDRLEHELKIKHPMTLWFDVKTKMVNSTAEFLYTSVHVTQVPSFETFISLIHSGIVTYDWRGYTSISGKYKGKNHGNAWRIDKKHLNLLFGTSEIIDLLK